MKKLNLHARLWQKNRNERILRDNHRKLFCNYRSSSHTRTQIFAPEILDIYANRFCEKTIGFLTRIRTTALKQGTKVYLRFENTRAIASTAMILLLAEVHRAIHIHGSSIIKANYPKVEKSEQVFQQIGFLDLVGKKSRLNEADFPEDVDSWRYATGTIVDLAIAEPLLVAISELFELDSDSPIYRGISEAITNSHQHAHSMPRDDGVPSGERRWWLFGQVLNNKLTLVVCDLGVGIPVTIPAQHASYWDRFLSQLNKRKASDGLAIQAAMELKRTSTKLKHRGKGLADLQNAVELAPGAALRVISNRGSYVYKNFHAREGIFPVGLIKADTRSSICGTVIAWTWPLDTEFDEISPAEHIGEAHA